MIYVRFFGQIRERLGCETLNLEYTGEHSVAEVKQTLVERGQDWEVLNGKGVLVAVNQTLCSINNQIHDGDEVAFFPPVTGG